MFGRAPARACVFVTLLATCGCGGDRGTAPTAPTPPANRPLSLKISGVPESLAPGASTQLRADVTLGDGTTKPCAASWSVSDARVATVDAAGLLTGGITGYVTVMAACEGLTVTADTKTSAACPYSLVIVAVDREVGTEFGVAATLEFLDGPRAGERIQTGSAFNAVASNTEWPVRVRVTADSYETADFVLAENTGTRRNKTSPLFDFRLPMTFRPDPLTDTHVRTMSRSEMEIAHPFVLAAAGIVEIRTWWSVDYNDLLYVELWCGGQPLRSQTQLFGSAGGGFSQSVAAPGPCEVRLRQSKSDAGTHYRVAIRYPH